MSPLAKYDSFFLFLLITSFIPIIVFFYFQNRSTC